MVVGAVIVGKEGGAVVFQEFGVAAAAGAGHVGLVLHGVAFHLRGGRKGQGEALFAGQDLKGKQRTPDEVCELADMASFMDDQLGFPVERVKRPSGRRGIEFDAPRRPGYAAVAVHVVGLQDDGHAGRVDVEAGQRGFARAFESIEVFPGQRVNFAGKDHGEVIALDLAPADGRGGTARGVILGPCLRCAEQQEQKEDDGNTKPHRTAKIHKFHTL